MYDFTLSIVKSLGRAQDRSGRVRKISTTAGFDPRTVQPVASRYTDYDIPAHTTYFLHLVSPYIFIFNVSLRFRLVNSSVAEATTGIQYCRCKGMTQTELAWGSTI
jgi:hypothetical protein